MGDFVTERIPVDFEGEGEGVEELSWGQREIWNAMQRQRSFLPIGFAGPLPAGTTLDDAAADLRYFVGRHQSLRTRLRFDACGRARQVVSATGTVTLDVVDAGDRDPAAVAAEVEQAYRAGPMDYVRDWPVRMAVVRARGRLTHQVIIMSHLVADGFGAMTMLDQHAAGDTRPVTAQEPMAQAAWQRTPAGRRQSDLAMRYWERLLWTVAPHRFPAPGEPARPRYWEAVYDSPAMYLASRRLASRTRLDTSYLLLAAAARGLHEVTGIDPVVLRVVVSNRFRPGLADTVSPVNQTGLCVIEVGDAPFDELVNRCWRAAMGSYKHAYYDPVQLEALIDRIGRERGVPLDLGCFFNDRRIRTARTASDGPVPTAADVRAAVPGAMVSWRRSDLPNDRFFAHVDDVPGTVRVTHCADTAYLPPAGMEAFLHAMEETLVDAAVEEPSVAGRR
jgi:hypothetical protein